MNKILSLQALRGIAFIGIFLCHAGSMIHWAGLGVSIFFVMSGFLMMYLHYDADKNITIIKALKFSFVRIKKIYRLHIITMAFAALFMLIIIIHKGISVKAILLLMIEIILNITLMQTWVPDTSINTSLNGVAWYLSVMMFLYCIFPYICRWIKNKRKSGLIIISVSVFVIEIISCWLCLSLLDIDEKKYIWFMYFFPIFRIGDFLIGCCMGKMYHHDHFSKMGFVRGTILEFIALILTVLVMIFLLSDKNDIVLVTIGNWTTLCIILAAMWLYLFLCNAGVFTKIMINRFFLFLGNISAYTFLIHFVIIKYAKSLISYCGVSMNAWNVMAIISIEFVLTIMATLGYLKLSEKNI